LIHSLSASPAAMVDQHQGHPRDNIGMSRTNLLATRKYQLLWELPANPAQTGTSFAVIEMAAYGRGSIQRLCNLTPPHAGIITAVGLPGSIWESGEHLSS